MARSRRLLAAWLLVAALAQAGVRRVVILKVDGLPQWFVEEALEERDPRTGKSRFPWIQYFFIDRGVELRNFYTRGISLSVPSWQMLDTGQNLQIHGNAEYDRYTQRSYDYLNFFPFYVGYARSKRVDMPAVEVLDRAGVPLLLDRFPVEQRYQGFQLFQRGVRWKTLESSLRNRFTRQPVQQLFDEWQAGMPMSSMINQQMERELIQKLADPNIRYLDYFTGDFDHEAHLTNDRSALLSTLEEIDRLIGRVGTALQASPLGPETLFVLVSDHGINTAPATYSQGYNLIEFFNSRQGGGHHVITNRYTMTEYKIRGLNPFVNKVLSPSGESQYLAGQSADYPTAILDLDGNERASVHLRNNALNQLHILLLKLSRKEARRPELVDMALSVLDENRARWQLALDELQQEIRSLKETPKDVSKEKSEAERRNAARLHSLVEDQQAYSEYSQKLKNLLTLNREQLQTGAFKIEELIPQGAMGEINTLEDLRHYTIGWNSDGHTFQSINYLQLLKSLRVRNSVQAQVAAGPVDFIAVRVPDGILLYGGEEYQAKILQREDGALRYQPLGTWKPDLPLHLLEDAELPVPGDRITWLSGWHSEQEWLRAVHRTKYSNGLIGLVEELGPVSGKSRQLTQTDMLIVANDHWNFNVRGFNPGGNHGSFLRISTHSVLMMWGGAKTDLPNRKKIDEPYDSLSFVPTVLQLLGKSVEGLPGRPIQELTGPF